MHLHSTKVLVFLYILIFLGCSVPPQHINENESLELSTTKNQQIKEEFYTTIDSQTLLDRIPPLVLEIRSALSDSDKIKELELQSSIEALNYERDLVDILRDLDLLEKMLIDLKSDTEFSFYQAKQNNYSIPKLPFKLSTMQKIALENRQEILEYNYQESIAKREGNPMLLSLEQERKKELYLGVITDVGLKEDQYKQSVNAYKLSKEYLDLSEEICEKMIHANGSNATSKLTIIQEKFNYLLAMLKHSFAYVDMQKSYAKTYTSLGILQDSDLEYEQDRPTTLEPDFMLELQIQKNKRIQRDKHLLHLQELERINEIRKQKQFQIIKQQEEKRRLERIEKRNEKKRLEISKKLQVQKYSDAQETLEFKEQKLLEAIARIDEKKHLQQMRKIQNIHSLDGIRSMIEEIKAEIVQLKSL